MSLSFGFVAAHKVVVAPCSGVLKLAAAISDKEDLALGLRVGLRRDDVRNHLQLRRDLVPLEVLVLEVAHPEAVAAAVARKQHLDLKDEGLELLLERALAEAQAAPAAPDAGGAAA